MSYRVIVIFLGLSLGSLAENRKWNRFKNPNYMSGRDVIVHLFEWKWNDIAEECEKFLGPMGFAGVQISPPTENLIIEGRPWLERYQPISYNWITRSGNEEEFNNMVRRCNIVGVRIYVDIVLNHMTGNMEPAVGTGGSIAKTRIRSYPAVPYSWTDFNRPCKINNWQNVTQLRNCQVLGLDLDHTKKNVRRKIVRLMNKLIDAGVAGFRIDAAKHMWPIYLGHMYSRLHRLNTNHGFSENSRPYIYQDVSDYSQEAIFKNEYILIAAVTEFDYGLAISRALTGRASLRSFKNVHELRDLIPSEDALVFIDTHKTQRLPSFGILSHKSPKLYRIAVAFMLAYPYGNPRVMSSYAFEDIFAGPPADEDGNITSPIITNDGSCEGGWICEHRWRQIYNMVAFRRTVSGTNIENWWDNGSNQIAFSRGDRGFIAINGDPTDFIAMIPTRLPPGIYCDVISGNLINGACSGKSVDVEEGGNVYITMLSDEDDGVKLFIVMQKFRIYRWNGSNPAF